MCSVRHYRRDLDFGLVVTKYSANDVEGKVNIEDIRNALYRTANLF